MAVYGTILCLGDSLTHGARDEYYRCYPMELSDLLGRFLVRIGSVPKKVSTVRPVLTFCAVACLW